VTFSELNLNTPILNALNDLGLEHPTVIQERAFSVIMSGKDVIGLAQTGTGKTFAYIMPLLRLHTFSKSIEPRILVLVPTRELVIQVVEEFEKVAKYMNIRIGGVYGGVNMAVHTKLVHDGLDVIVGTPGRLIDLGLTGVLKLKYINKLVIDEVDEMLNLGFRSQINTIFDLLPKKRQNLMFSATLTPDVEQMIEVFFNDTVKIEAASHGTPLEKIIQKGYKVANFNTKINLLMHLLDTEKDMNRVLVFTDSKRFADLLYNKITEEYNEEFGLIHSNKSQNFRIRSLVNFQNGTNRVLIATDLVARGLDISDVSHVINFDIPDEPETYIHRIGRTGRADKNGIAITFVTEDDSNKLVEIEKLMNKSLDFLNMPKAVEISDLQMEFEKKILPGLMEREVKVKIVPNAFHEKSKKNSKTNLGSKYKREIEGKFKKPIRRSNNGKRD
jgi:ATP-dependent RNA helicase RhlE